MYSNSGKGEVLCIPLFFDISTNSGGWGGLKTQEVEYFLLAGTALFHKSNLQKAVVRKKDFWLRIFFSVFTKRIINKVDFPSYRATVNLSTGSFDSRT